MSDNKKPNIRFKGYSDDWEQRKLIDVCDYVDYRGKTPTKTDSGFFLVTAKNVKDGYIDYGASQEYISEDDYEEVMHRGKPEIGDVLITTEAPCGNVAQVNRADIALAQRIIKYRGQSNIVDNTYLKYYLLSPEFQNILNAKSSGGTVKGIKGSILHQQEIKYPKYEEQFKIGSYFNNLDNLITLHQRKYDKLQTLKKAMLEKMFPKNGSNVPEIRFKGFTDAWERRKLNEITDVRDGTHDSPKYVQEGHPFITSKNVSNGFINYDDVQYVTDEDYEEINKRSKVDVHDILMGMIGTIGNLALIRKEPDFAIKNVALIKYTGDIEYKYLYQALQVDCVMSQLSTGMDGGTQKFVSLKKIRELDIPFPEECEQKKIGAYFSNLDTLITLHQRELEKLQNIKKAMLEKMFV